MNGKHAKPSSNKNAKIAAVSTLTLGGVGLPLLAAVPASAASVSTWDRIAQCESSGRWFLPGGDADSTGGLQIQDRTWRAYGGEAIAPHAYQASKKQQIEVAQKILAAQGPRAWSTTFNGSPCTGINLSVLPLPYGPGAPAPVKKVPPKVNPVAPDPKPVVEHHGRHLHKGWHHRHHHHKPVTPPPVVKADHYKVKPGDYLIKIARDQYGDASGWIRIYHANKSQIKDPNLIFPGQVFVIPRDGKAVPPPVAPPVKPPVTPPVKTPPPAPAPGVSAQVSQVLSLVNAERAKAGLSALSLDATLNGVAADHSKWMAANQNLTHDLPADPGQRMAAAGLHPMAWGENIADGQSTAAEVMSDWMNSPGHRANILSGDFHKIGIGYVVDSSGHAWWTQDFTS